MQHAVSHVQPWVQPAAQVSQLPQALTQLCHALYVHQKLVRCPGPPLILFRVSLRRIIFLGTLFFELLSPMSTTYPERGPWREMNSRPVRLFR